MTVTGLQQLATLYLSEYEAVRAKAVKSGAAEGEATWLDDARNRLVRALKAGEDIHGRISLKAAHTLELLARTLMYEEEIELSEIKVASSRLIATSTIHRCRPRADALRALPVDSHRLCALCIVSPRNLQAAIDVSAPCAAPTPPAEMKKQKTGGAALEKQKTASGSALKTPTVPAGRAGRARSRVPLSEDEALLSNPRLMLDLALSFRATLQGAQHRDVAACHLKLADYHWLHKDFQKAIEELGNAHTVHEAVAGNVDLTGSRELGKIKSLLAVAHVCTDELDKAHRCACARLRMCMWTYLPHLPLATSTRDFVRPWQEQPRNPWQGCMT